MDTRKYPPKRHEKRERLVCSGTFKYHSEDLILNTANSPYLQGKIFMLQHEIIFEIIVSLHVAPRRPVST